MMVTTYRATLLAIQFAVYVVRRWPRWVAAGFVVLLIVGAVTRPAPTRAPRWVDGGATITSFCQFPSPSGKPAVLQSVNGPCPEHTKTITTTFGQAPGHWETAAP